MLRVVSLGLSLPRSTFNSFESFRAILSPWDLLPHVPTSLRARSISEFAARWPEPLKAEENTDLACRSSDLPATSKQEALSPAEENTQQRHSVGQWKVRFLREERLHRPIRALRPPRLPPRYACPPESGLSEDTGADLDIAPPLVLHPLHREPKKPKGNGSLGEFLATEQVSSDTSRQARHATQRGLQSRDELLQVLAETQSTYEAWEAYNVLHKRYARTVSHNQRMGHLVDRAGIPFAHLHRLARLLSSTRPRTRDLFMRLLSVVTTLRASGAHVFAWEWNALIDCAGKGWRKTRMEDYRAAVDVFKDMVSSRQTLLSSELPRSRSSSGHGESAPTYSRYVAQPDIITFTTLLSLASRTLSEDAITHATSLLDASELPWNHITHMARLRYFIQHNDMEAVRDILRNSVNSGLKLDTLNGCLWAFARSGRLIVALQVYGILRRNVLVESRLRTEQADQSLTTDIGGFVGKDIQDNPILNIPGLVIPSTMQPDGVTYALMIQALCYHGDLINALALFRDMLTTLVPTSGKSGVDNAESSRRYYKPNLQIYRAIFLGFARYAGKKPTLASNLSRRRFIDVIPLPEFAARLTASNSGTGHHHLQSSPERDKENTAWTLENLDTLFESFLEMDWDRGAVEGDGSGNTTSRPSDRTVYWIMVAYAKTTKRDLAKMHKVWQQLDTRFGYGADSADMWGGRLARIAEALEKRQTRSGSVQNGDQTIHSNG